MKRVIRASVDTYRGYDIEQEKSHDHRFYFLDDRNKLHFADLLDEMKAKIDVYIDIKSYDVNG